MTQTFDRRIVIGLFVAVTLGLACAAIGVYRSKENRLQSLHGQLAAEDARLADVKGKIGQMGQLEASYASLAERLGFLEKPLPDAAYIPTFLAQIERLAEDTSNGIAVIRPKEKLKTAPTQADTKINNETGEIVKNDAATPAKDDKKNGAAAAKPELPYDFVPIEMKVEGTYWTALQFLQQLERFPKMIAVDSVGFSPQTTLLAATSGDQPLTISLDLTAVVMKGAKDGDAK